MGTSAGRRVWSMRVVDRVGMDFSGGEQPRLLARPRKDACEILKPHFRQGRLDGACGVYSLTMLLALHGKDLAPHIDAALTELLIEHVISASRDSDLDVEDLRKSAPLGVLLGNGTDAQLWRLLLQRVAPKWRLVNIIEPELKGRGPKYAGRRTLLEARALLDQGIPLLIEMAYGDGGHAAVVVGYTAANQVPDRLLLLDPASDPPSLCPWNSVLERLPSVHSAYRFRWADADSSPYPTPVRIDGLHRAVLKRVAARSKSGSKAPGSRSSASSTMK